MKDWMVRSVKTFVQAFGGVLIPEIVLLLSGGFPESISSAWRILSPVVAAALAAAISAVWNIVKPPATATPAAPATLEEQIKARLTQEQMQKLRDALDAVMRAGCDDRV